MTTSSAPEADTEPRLDALHKTVVRLVAGGVGEGIDRLMALANQLEEADTDPESAEVTPIHADPRLMTLVGWLSELPAQARATKDSTARVFYPFTRAIGIAVDTGAYIARTTGVTAFVEGATEPMRTAIAEERERLASVGVGEYTRGRVLAVHAFEQSVDGIMGYIGESDELGELVREQTLGITGSAVREMRETGAAADGLTEGIFRRLLGREVRAVPPKPHGDTDEEG